MYKGTSTRGESARGRYIIYTLKPTHIYYICIHVRRPIYKRIMYRGVRASTRGMYNCNQTVVEETSQYYIIMVYGLGMKTERPRRFPRKPNNKPPCSSPLYRRKKRSLPVYYNSVQNRSQRKKNWGRGGMKVK